MPPDAAVLLGAVAAALTACEEAGLKPRLKHGAVYTREGFVLPADASWVARTLQWSPFSPGDDDDE